jgi:hypothetical protein
MSFQLFTTDQLIDYCKSFKWTRKIKQLHVHHTYSPDHKDYTGSNGIKLQEAMEQYHVKDRGWKAIGQHLTLLPDGQWITGRDFNLDPASISGWNSGAFAVEMLGNFDRCHDKFFGIQAEAMFVFCAFICDFKRLNVDADIKFHRDSPTAGKTCPGTSIDKAWFISQIKASQKVTETMQNVQILFDNKILTDKDKWLKKASSDSDVYWLIKKMANKLKGGK